MFYFPLVEKIAGYIKRGGSWVYWAWVILVGLLGTVVLKVWKEDGFDDAYPLLFFLLFFWIFGGLLVAQYEKHREKTSDETTTDKSK